MAERSLRGPTADAAPFVHEKMLALLDGEKRGLLLDAPAGRGAFALQAKRMGYDVTCGDIECARFEAEGLQCEPVDLNRTWPYGDARFDVVACIEAIEHLENPWLLVREANRVLKPGGVFLVTTPNVLSIKSRKSYLLNGYPNYFFSVWFPVPASTKKCRSITSIPSDSWNYGIFLRGAVFTLRRSTRTAMSIGTVCSPRF